jgi:magnesium transporter
VLALHTCAQTPSGAPIAPSGGTLSKDIVWIDMINGNQREIALVEQAIGHQVPTRKTLSEIESSSRMYSENDALYLSIPMVVQASSAPTMTPVGFVLTERQLLTVRFDDLKVFDAFGKQAEKLTSEQPSSISVFTGLLEELVDLLADTLEEIGADLDAISTQIFGAEVTSTAGGKPPKRQDASLHVILRRVGRAGQLLSKARGSLLAIGRIAPYVEVSTEHWAASPEMKPRFERLRRDIVSLDEFQTHLTGNVQLLLDATLGLTSIEQNNIFKVLTIASVVGIPPTLVASMYGMNFKHMPELDWSWGYSYGLALIALSAIIPLVWFKLRGWF